jgi:hypothetical protein
LASNTSGAASIVIRATDSGALFVEDTFVVTVTPANDAPVIVSAIPDTSVVEDSGPVANYRNLTAVFNDLEDGSALAFSVQSNSNPGLVNAMIDESENTLYLGFTQNVTGSATLILRATDSGALWVQDTFVVTVTGVNDPPVVAHAIPNLEVAYGTLSVQNYRDLNQVFSDFEDGGALGFAVVSNSDTGIVTVTIDADSALDVSFASDTTGSATLIIRATDSGGLFAQDTLVVTLAGLVTAIGDPELIDRFALHQNTPNPFNPTTVIRYEVPAGGGEVALRIYDATGRLIRTLADGFQVPGERTVTWDGTDAAGNPLASGIYFYRLQAPGFERSRKMVLLR